MATSPLFTKHKSYIQRKIMSYCQNNFNSNFPSSDCNRNNDNNIFAKFHRDTIEKKNNINMFSSSHIVNKMKNDYLIKKKDSQGELNMNILNNPYISNKFKDKFHEVISITPNDSMKKNYLNSMRNQYQEKTVFERKQKELLNIITDNGSIYTQRGNKEGSFLHNSPERGFTNDKLSMMEKFIDRTIHTPRGDYLDLYKSMQEQNKKERLIKNKKKQNEQRQLDDFVSELTERRARENNEDEDSKHSKAKSDFLSSFFV